jgi:hypothetical protein
MENKTCHAHPDSFSVAVCKTCEKSLCLMCVMEEQGENFCSSACISAWKEVQSWVDQTAKPEDWNPLAQEGSSGHVKKVLKDDESVLDMSGFAPKAKGPEPLVVPGTSRSTIDKACASHRDTPALGMCLKCGRAFCGVCAVETSWGSFCSMPCSVSYRVPAEGAPETRRRLPAEVVAVAAVVLVVAAFVAIRAFSGPPEPPPVPKPEVAKVAPPPLPAPMPPAPAPVAPKPEVAKPEPPKPPPPTPVTPKPEVAKPEPPKPEPPKPPAPPPVAPKPEVVKPEPPKPPPPIPAPPKPEVAKPEPPKPEPPKPPPPPPVAPKPEVVKPEPPKPKPEPPRHLVVARDPWMSAKPGSWYRLRTVSAKGESYSDVGLKERGPWYLVTVSQTRTPDGAQAEQHKYIDLADLTALRPYRFVQDGRTIDFDLAELPGRKGVERWVLADGRQAGLILPEEWAGAPVAPRRFDAQMLEVKGRTFDCLVLETETAKLWLSLECPAGPVQAQAGGTETRLIDFGDDWSKRPPFPEAAIARAEPPRPPEPPKPVPPEPPKPVPPKPEVAKPEPPKPPPPTPVPPKPEVAKPEPPKPPPRPEVVKPPPPPVDDAAARAQRSLGEAASRIREAAPLYAAIAQEMEAGVWKADALRSLQRRSQDVRLKLAEAQRLYSSARASVADRAAIDARLEKLRSLLETLDGFGMTIQDRLKRARS